MNGSMDEELELVARRLRTWRDEAELTLQQLAERCGVATSTIQKIETRQMVPTIAVLLKIASGLGKQASEFVTRDDSTYQIHKGSPGTRRVFGDGAHIHVERLVGDLASPQLEVWRARCDDPEKTYRSGIFHHGELLLICEAGSMTVHVDGKPHELRAGDTLHFKAALEHGWENHPGEDLEFIVIGTLAPTLRAVLGDSKPPHSEP